MKNLGHLMLDLETMGKRSGCAIVSIGAVEFDIVTGETGREFYERIDLQSCLDVGLFVQASTLYWWLQQSDAARLELCKENISIQEALVRYRSFTTYLGDYQIWGNSANFDIGILEAAVFACGYTVVPWYFRNERDVRTLVSFAPQVKENHP
ncbi:MAG: 3'-5' exoribonuclease, partial [Nitrosopumilales archaeon]